MEEKVSREYIEIAKRASLRADLRETGVISGVFPKPPERLFPSPYQKRTNFFRRIRRFLESGNLTKRLDEYLTNLKQPHYNSKR